MIDKWWPYGPVIHLMKPKLWVIKQCNATWPGRSLVQTFPWDKDTSAHLQLTDLKTKLTLSTSFMKGISDNWLGLNTVIRNRVWNIPQILRIISVETLPVGWLSDPLTKWLMTLVHFCYVSYKSALRIKSIRQCLRLIFGTNQIKERKSFLRKQVK